MARKIFNFHGAFNRKRDAVRKEGEVKHSFIRKILYPGGSRFDVLTRKGK